jgi:hypothetical protein
MYAVKTLFDRTASFIFIKRSFTAKALRKRNSGILPSTVTPVSQKLSGSSSSSLARLSTDVANEKHENLWDRKWNENYLEYKAALERNEEPSSSLKAWIYRQRSQHKLKQEGKRSLLTDERAQKLAELNVTLEPEFDMRYNQLKEFVRKNNGLFPYDFKSHDKSGQALLDWCHYQRHQYKQMLAGNKSFMKQENIDLLNQIGFVWNERDLLWGHMFGELKKFVTEHNHAFVHRCALPQLGRWCDNQRQYYRHIQKFGSSASLTPKRFQLLDEIGFPWDARDVRWQEKYCDLVRYVKLRGSQSLPSFADKEFGKLRYWLRHQKVQHRKFVGGESSSMTPQRIKLLDEQLGSLWKKDVF